MVGESRSNISRGEGGESGGAQIITTNTLLAPYCSNYV